MLKDILNCNGVKELDKKEQTKVLGGLKRCRGNTNNSTGCCHNGAWIPAGHSLYARFCLA